MNPNPVEVNTYPTLEAAKAAQAYFSKHGATVRPGEPVEVRAGYAVAYAWPAKSAVPEPDADAMPLKPGYRPVAGVLCSTHGLPLCAHPDLSPGLYRCLSGHLAGRCACGKPSDPALNHGMPTCTFRTARPADDAKEPRTPAAWGAWAARVGMGRKEAQEVAMARFMPAKAGPATADAWAKADAALGAYDAARVAMEPVPAKGA